MKLPRNPSPIRAFLQSESAGGLVLMAAAAAALIVANSPLSGAYFAALAAYLGPLSVGHWINDGLMAVFFLAVGLEIKREAVEGQLSTWPRRILPGLAALGGMIVPALIYVAINWRHPENLRGWAIPTATDIAFALGVLSLLGSRVPGSLKIFLTALAIIDDLGAVLIIALFYTEGLSPLYLAGAALVVVILYVMNRRGVTALAPYLVLGAILWVLVLNSGIHATIAGVVLAMTIPIRPDEPKASPLHRLEGALHGVVPFAIVPLFGFANAGLSFAGMSAGALVDPLTLGVALGLVLGKVTGVFGAVCLAIRMDWAERPVNASFTDLFGVALLCGIGFTMSLFIALLAFAGNVTLQNDVKIGILLGSFAAAILGALVFALSARRRAAS